MLVACGCSCLCASLAGALVVAAQVDIYGCGDIAV